MFDPVGCHKQQCHSLVTYRARIIPYLRKAYYFKTIFNNLVIIFKKKKTNKHSQHAGNMQKAYSWRNISLFRNNVLSANSIYTIFIYLEISSIAIEYAK